MVSRAWPAAEKEVRGAVWNLSGFQQKLLCGVSNKVTVFKWLVADNGGRELMMECGHSSNVLALYLATR